MPQSFREGAIKDQGKESVLANAIGIEKTSDSILPSHWENLKLGDLGRISGGGTPSTKVIEYWGKDIPWLTPGEISRIDNVFISDTERRITDIGLINSSLDVLPVGTVLMTSRATIGEVAINTVPMTTNQGFINIICNTRLVNNLFFAYWIKHNKSKLEARGYGATFKEISKPNFKAVSITLPPLPEQRAIAHVLQTVQQAIQAQRKELELERERKAALMHHLFTYGTRNEPMKQSEVGEIPKSWEIVSFGKVCQFLQYGTSEPCNDEVDGMPVLRIPNVINGYIDIQDLKFVKLPEKTIESLSLAAGDLLFVRTNGNRAYAGRCSVFNGELEKALFASYLIRARLEDATILPKFAQLYTMIDKGRKYLSGKSSNAADGKFNINTQTIRQIQIVIPSLEEQKFIVDVVEACETKIVALEKEITLHEELFRTLLDELMTGRIPTLPLIEQARERDFDR